MGYGNLAGSRCEGAIGARYGGSLVPAARNIGRRRRWRWFERSAGVGFAMVREVRPGGKIALSGEIEAFS